MCVCKIVPESAVGHSNKIVTKKELSVVNSILIPIQYLVFFQVLLHSCLNPLLLVFQLEKVSIQI